MLKVSQPFIQKCTLRSFLVSIKICISQILLYIYNLLVLNKFNNSFQYKDSNSNYENISLFIRELKK